MNKPLWLARILSIGGVLETVAGLGLLVAPSPLSTLLLRTPLEGAGVVFARLAGGSLLALGIACWSLRATPMSPAGLGMARGFLVYNLAACAILALACPAMPGGLFALGGAILHGLLAAGLLLTLFGPDKNP